MEIKDQELIESIIKKSIIFRKEIEKCKKIEKSRLIKFLKNIDFNVHDIRFLENDVQFLYVHCGIEFWCESKEESTGLLSCFYLAPFIFEAMENGNILIVDKKTVGLHPLLIKHLEYMFIREYMVGARIIFI